MHVEHAELSVWYIGIIQQMIVKIIILKYTY